MTIVKREPKEGNIKGCGGWGDQSKFANSSLTWASLGTGSSRTWLLADSKRTWGKARITAEREGLDGAGPEEEEGSAVDERRGRMGNSGRSWRVESERREVQSRSGNTTTMGSIFTYNYCTMSSIT